MRIISGTAGGIPIKAPSSVTRPTTDRVREAVFSMLGGDCSDWRVLDLFAGSGALGLECLSRGAHTATFVDQNQGVVQVIKENLIKTQLTGAQILKLDVWDALKRLRREGQKFDVIFADPPYEKNAEVVPWTRLLLENEDLQQLLAPDGFFVLESQKSRQADEHGSWELWKDRSYGISRIRIFTLA